MKFTDQLARRAIVLLLILTLANMVTSWNTARTVRDVAQMMRQQADKIAQQAGTTTEAAQTTTKAANALCSVTLGHCDTAPNSPYVPTHVPAPASTASAPAR